jgi:hypothetical protein
MKRYVGFLAIIAVMVTRGFALSPEAGAVLFDFEGAPYAPLYQFRVEISCPWEGETPVEPFHNGSTGALPSSA